MELNEICFIVTIQAYAKGIIFIKVEFLLSTMVTPWLQKHFLSLFYCSIWSKISRIVHRLSFETLLSVFYRAI